MCGKLLGKEWQCSRHLNRIPSMTPIRQTQSYLRSLFAKHGISPRHRLGQNFLIDLNIHDLIVDAAEWGRTT